MPLPQLNPLSAIAAKINGMAGTAAGNPAPSAPVPPVPPINTQAQTPSALAALAQAMASTPSPQGPPGLMPQGLPSTPQNPQAIALARALALLKGTPGVVQGPGAMQDQTQQFIRALTSQMAGQAGAGSPLPTAGMNPGLAALLAQGGKQ